MQQLQSSPSTATHSRKVIKHAQQLYLSSAEDHMQLQLAKNLMYQKSSKSLSMASIPYVNLLVDVVY